ncbi:hypothetical protein ABL840_26015 [Variovorax sp. NFACC27]|uniref:hypothetical protein n=1 Tax=unclassified Variovorax TaxID=663243 RepID=UPI000895C1CC|nr:hypothetical protein SAMN03159371_03846 [Variovorax sp. NFACC28]SEG79503.1 hypothetical protein SAMN03159365_03924 [Variovorax sp. NFACC29]SFC92652.1 hypothetical protein SAMN03159379_03500 [Variovorax sp. NFACC26]SFG06607.1 hypothetical protein SAMN03159447_01608 [Variovorax sp. NFACC27]
MHYLLFIGAILFFAFMTPLKLTVAVCALLLVVTVVVKVSAQVVSGSSPTLGESFKSVFYASLLVALGLLAFVSFSSGTGIHHVEGWPAVAVLVGLFVAYTLGFQIGIGTSFGASAVVALISTLVAGAILWSVKNLASF